MFTMIFCNENGRLSEIVGDGNSIMDIYNLICKNPNIMVIHVYRQGNEYNPETGLRDIIIPESEESISKKIGHSC